MKYHTTKDGTKIKLNDLELSHLKNILRWIDRKAADGLTIVRGGGGFDVTVCGTMKIRAMAKMQEESLTIITTKLN